MLHIIVEIFQDMLKIFGVLFILALLLICFNRK